MPEVHSKLANAMVDVLMRIPPTGQERDIIARMFDERLAEIRKHYEPEELARCPIVSHHREPCPFCICAAMRAFILVPEGKP